MEHHFNVSIAQKIGVNEAIFLNNIAFWTQKNLANNRHIHDGLCWTYNTIQAFCDLFPYWTRHQLEHLIKKCVKEGLLVEGNYNKSGYDRTKWYALTPDAQPLFPTIFTDKNKSKMTSSTISEISEIDFGKKPNGIRKSPKPIPDSKKHIEKTYVCATHTDSLESECLNDAKTNELFKEKFAAYDVGLKDLFNACRDYHKTKLTKYKFYQWVQKEDLENHRKIDAKQQKTETHEQKMARYARERQENMPESLR